MKHFCSKDGHYQHRFLLNETMLMMPFNALMTYILLLPSNNAQVLCFMERTWRIPTRFSCDCRTPQWLTIMACIMALSLCNPNPSNIYNHNLNFLEQFGCKYVTMIYPVLSETILSWHFAMVGHVTCAAAARWWYHMWLFKDAWIIACAEEIGADEDRGWG
jgi:hypothetical protein